MRVAARDLALRIGKTLTDHSPTLLTVVGVAGTIATAVLTGKAAFKSAQILDDLEDEAIRGRRPDLEPREKLEAVWKLYIPPVAMGGLTIASIILANRIGTRRAAALAAAYAISEKAFVEYKDKVVEKLGDRKERDIRDEVAQDHVNRVNLQDAVIIGGGSVLCFDTFTGRYFMSDMETIKKAQNDTNYQIFHDMYASVSDFYNRVGLPPTDISDEFGWSTDELLEVNFSTVLSENGTPVLTVTFHSVPIRHYHRLQ